MCITYMLKIYIKTPLCPQVAQNLVEENLKEITSVLSKQLTGHVIIQKREKYHHQIKLQEEQDKTKRVLKQSKNHTSMQRSEREEKIEDLHPRIRKVVQNHGQTMREFTNFGHLEHLKWLHFLLQEKSSTKKVYQNFTVLKCPCIIQICPS